MNNRGVFVLSARDRYNKSDVKRFMKACDKRFGPDAVQEYRLDFTVQLVDGSMYAYSTASGRPQFYEMAAA